MSAQVMTATEAKLTVAAQDKIKLIKALEKEQTAALAAKATANKRRNRFERTVAIAVSAKPDREDWYEHPGPVPASDVRKALGLSTMQMHRIMARYRTKLAGAGRRG